MKKQLLLLAGMLCFVVTAWAAPTAKAIYCAANTTLYFTYDEVTYNTSTAYDNLDGNTPTNIYNSLNPVGGYTCTVSVNGTSRAGTYDYSFDFLLRNNTTPWKDIATEITSIKFLDNFNSWIPTSLQAYFANMTSLVNVIGGENVNTSELTSLKNTFANCQSLPNLQFLSEWNTEKVTDLEGTFSGCTSLVNLEGLENWETGEVTTMNSTFTYCTGLTSLKGLESWDISKVGLLFNTFRICSNLKNVDALSEWQPLSVYRLQQTFEGCDALENVNGLKKWNTSSVKDITDVFCYCRSLSDISGLADWDMSKVECMYGAFECCISLTNVDALSKWDTSNVVNMTGIFSSSKNLADLSGISGWDVSNVVNMQNLITYNQALPNLDDLSKWNTKSLKNLKGAFRNNIELLNIEGLRNWDTNTLFDLESTFYHCEKLQSVEPIYNWDTKSLYNMRSIFSYCLSLTGRIDLSNWDLSSLKNSWGEYCVTSLYSSYMSGSQPLAYAFSNLPNVIGISLGKGNMGSEVFTSGAIDFAFQSCPKLRYIDLSGCTDTFGNIVSVTREGEETYNEYSQTYYMKYKGMFGSVPRTTVIYLPQGNTEAEESDHENVVYTDDAQLLQCDKYYSEDKVDIELPHRFHADLATYERTFNSNYGGVILPYPVKINDNDEDEFQPFLLQREFKDHMFFKGIAEVPANTPFCFKRKQASTDMTFRMEDLWVESTYDISGETSDNVEEGFAWKTQGFYVNNVIEPENGTFSIPTMDDYVGTENVDYEVDHVYYLSKNRFYRCDDAKLTLAPHRILFYGLWEKYSGTDPEMSGSFDFEELGDDVVDAIQAAETDMDEAKAAAIYDANGNRLSKTQHGLNILRMSDGSVKKVIKK